MLEVKQIRLFFYLYLFISIIVYKFDIINLYLFWYIFLLLAAAYIVEEDDEEDEEEDEDEIKPFLLKIDFEPDPLNPINEFDKIYDENLNIQLQPFSFETYKYIKDSVPDLKKFFYLESIKYKKSYKSSFNLDKKIYRNYLSNARYFEAYLTLLNEEYYAMNGYLYGENFVKHDPQNLYYYVDNIDRSSINKANQIIFTVKMANYLIKNNPYLEEDHIEFVRDAAKEVTQMRRDIWHYSRIKRDVPAKTCNLYLMDFRNYKNVWFWEDGVYYEHDYMQEIEPHPDYDPKPKETTLLYCDYSNIDYSTLGEMNDLYYNTLNLKARFLNNKYCDDDGEKFTFKTKHLEVIEKIKYKQFSLYSLNSKSNYYNSFRYYLHYNKLNNKNFFKKQHNSLINIFYEKEMQKKIENNNLFSYNVNRENKLEENNEKKINYLKIFLKKNKLEVEWDNYEEERFQYSKYLSGYSELESEFDFEYKQFLKDKKENEEMEKFQTLDDLFDLLPEYEKYLEDRLENPYTPLL